MEVSKGAYDLVVCKPGYEAVAKSIVLTVDISVTIEIETAPEPEDPAGWDDPYDAVRGASLSQRH